MKQKLPLLIMTILLASCASPTDKSAGAAAPAAAAAPAVSVAPAARKAYFGELHLHTGYSFDAWSLMGTRTTPEEAYRFASGDSISYMGRPVRRTWPLDFTAVTDHSENMGVMNQLDDPQTAFAKSKLGQDILKNPASAFYIIKNAIDRHAIPAEMSPRAAMASAWDREIKAANDAYRPGRFTTFIAYEWSSMAQGKYNLHRNVIFRGDHAPLPFTAADSPRPEDLWSYLEKARTQGVEALAIPHNGNVSNGLMYDWNDSDGRPIDEVYAQRRAVNEPLTEIAQNKGQSETMPEISGADEFANFETFDRLLTQPDRISAPHGSYIREAYGRGLVVGARVGVNPYKMGVVGATDFHNGLSTQDESAFAGGPFSADPHNLPTGDAAKRRLAMVPTPALIDENAAATGAAPVNEDITRFSSGGLTGVWAEANTRAAIYDALRRKETFATSGPRLRVRVFGGWDFEPAMLRQTNWVAAAYAHGAPMGADLPARPAGAAAPAFIVQAMKAPDSGNLDRIQIVKVWLDGGAYKEKVFNVALSGNRTPDPKTGRAAPIGDTVDLKTGAYTNTIGAASLQTVWRDPEFDPARPAVYYARVLEIPTPRWTTLLAIKNHFPLPPGRAATIQERAWSSPIWFTPAAGGAPASGPH